MGGRENQCEVQSPGARVRMAKSKMSCKINGKRVLRGMCEATYGAMSKKKRQHEALSRERDEAALRAVQKISPERKEAKRNP